MSTEQDELELRRSQQLEFLLTVLSLIQDSDSNSDEVYLLLRQHLELIDDGLVEVLKDWVTATFAEVDLDQQKSIAIDIGNLGNLMQEFPVGNKSVNIELSISCHEIILGVFTCNEAPAIWAAIQNNLANAYLNRIKGDRAENLEKAIEFYKAALEIYTPESFPQEWAAIQIRLAQFSISQLSNYQIATEHLQAAYEKLSTNHQDMGLLAQTMFELARCFHQTGELNQAKIYFKDSIRLYQRLEQPTQVAAVTSELGNLELQMGQIDDARVHLQAALDFYKTNNNLQRMASIQELQKYLPIPSPPIAS